jgi:thiamine phosphate synthase YjbQ (UPF0047 family)
LVSPSHNHVYHLQTDRTYKTFSIVPNRKRLRSPKYIAIGTCTQTPEDTEPTTTTNHGTFVWCHGSQPAQDTVYPTRTLANSIHEDDQWAIQSFHYEDQDKHIAQASIQGTAIAVCGGSYKDQFGTAGFVIQHGNNKEARITGAHVTPGHPEDINPYHSELGGILAIVAVSEAITKLHDIQSGIIKLGCDGQSGIIAIFEHEYDTPKQPHHNLIHEICQKIAGSRLTWKYCHIQGHQDKHISYNMLDTWGQLNVEMDSLAKAYWNETQASTPPFYTPSTSGWSLWVGNQKLTSWNRQALYNHAKAPKIFYHWSQGRQIAPQVIHSIDWEAGHQAIKQLGVHKSLWIPKWLSGVALVRKVQQRNKMQDHAKCPRCANFKTTRHVLLCQAPNAQRQWDATITTLDVWFKKALTLPDVHKAKISRLQSWRNQDKVWPAPSYNWPGVNDLILLQDLVGWQAFLEGRVLQAWAAKPQDYYDWLERRNTSKRWITTLIKKLWEISWSMWKQLNGELNNPASPASLQEHAWQDATTTRGYEDLSTLTNRDLRWFFRPK